MPESAPVALTGEAYQVFRDMLNKAGLGSTPAGTVVTVTIAGANVEVQA
jgi:hypothetical protein